MPIRALTFATVLAYAAFFLVDGFGPLLALGFVALSLIQATTPLVEAATLRATARGAIPYGVARGVGSLAFIFATTVGGFAIARFGLGAVVVWVLVATTLTAASAWFALAPDPVGVKAGAPRFQAVATLLRNRRYLTLIVACGLMQSGHAFYYGFSTLVWRGQGIAADAVGLLWALGVAVEVVFLWNLAWIERRVAPELMIVAGAAGGVLRWIAMGFAPTGPVLWPLQALHALSFAAVHVGAMRLLFRETPEQAAIMAQTLYSALAAGLLMGAATLLSGVLYDAYGAGGYWAMALVTGAGGLLALALLGSERQGFTSV